MPLPWDVEIQSKSNGPVCQCVCLGVEVGCLPLRRGTLLHMPHAACVFACARMERVLLG